MAKEIERKFLVTSDAFKALATPTHYRQGYVPTLNGMTVRIRIAGTQGYVTFKDHAVNLTRHEFEYPIPEEDALQMLDLMCATEDGFEIAERDMQMRGPGDLEGTQQSGLPIKLAIASLAKDGILLSDARSYADLILSRDPKLEHPENAMLNAELRKDKYTVKDYSNIS